MVEKRTRYIYKGAVYQYDNMVIRNYSASTYAVSEKQAKSRILARAKKMLGYTYAAGGFRLSAKVIEQND